MPRKLGEIPISKAALQTPARGELLQLRERSGYASLEALLQAGLIGRLNSRQAGNRTYLGTPVNAETGEVYKGFVVLAKPEHNTLVLGPSDAGKTTSLVETNAYLTEAPTIITSTRPETFFKIAPTLLAKGENVSVFDPTGELSAYNGDMLKALGVTPSTWSPFVDYDGTFDWGKRTADVMVKTSTLAEDRGDNQKYWELWTKGWLEPTLMKAAQATEQDFANLEVESRMEYFLKLSVLKPENARSVKYFLMDKIDQLEGKKNALNIYAKAVIGKDNPADRREILEAQLETTSEQREEAFREAKAASEALKAAKREAANKKAPKSEPEGSNDVVAGPSANGHSADSSEQTRLTPGMAVSPEAPTEASANGHSAETIDIDALTKRVHRLEKRRWVLEGALDQLEAMANSEDPPMTSEQAKDAAVEARLEGNLTLDQLDDIDLIMSQVNAPKRSDGKSSPSDVYRKMSQEVIDPWRNVATLKSTLVESGRPVFDPDIFFRNKNNKIFIFMPLDDANRFAPITNLFLTKATGTAIKRHREYPVLPTMLLDEAVLAGRIGDFADRISALREYVRLLTVAQTRALLEDKFGTTGRINIETNHQWVVDFTTGADLDDLDRVSRRVGSRRVEDTTRTWNESSGSGNSVGARDELHMRPDELNSLPEHTAVVKAKGFNILVKLDTPAELGLNQVLNEYERIPALVEELGEREANDYWNSRDIMVDGFVSAVESMQALKRAQQELATQPTIEENLRRFLEEQGISTRRDASVLLDNFKVTLRQAGIQTAGRLGVSEAELAERLPGLFAEQKGLPRSRR